MYYYMIRLVNVINILHRIIHLWDIDYFRGNYFFFVLLSGLNIFLILLITIVSSNLGILRINKNFTVYKDEQGKLLLDNGKILMRWKNYFATLLDNEQRNDKNSTCLTHLKSKKMNLHIKWRCYLND